MNKYYNRRSNCRIDSRVIIRVKERKKKKSRLKDRRKIKFEDPSTHLVLAYHRHLLHRVQNIVEHLIGMRSVNLVGALDAKIHGRWRLGGESDGYSMIVTHFARLRVARVRTGVSLTHERRQVICDSSEI